MGEGNSIINLGELAKPAEVLIAKVAGAIGAVCLPYQMKRIAKAEVEAAIIKAKGEVRITDLQRRAVERWAGEEAKKQENMEQILAKALPDLSGSSKPQEIEDDWVANFFDKCRIVSDEQMQALWAKVLAGEANAPGAYTRRTVNLLSSLGKGDAALFHTLCCFVWHIGQTQPLVYDHNASIYAKHGLHFGALSHLDDMGLISFHNVMGLCMPRLPQQMCVFYRELPVLIEFAKPADNELKLGAVMFTQAGHELARICGSMPIDGFVEYIIDLWIKEGLVLSCPMQPVLP